MQRFTHLSNLKNKLGLSTPYASGAGEGLVSTVSNFGIGSFSVGIKFRKTDIANNGYLIYCDDSVIAKTMYWALESVGDDLRFNTSMEGAQTMYGALEEDKTYHLYFYVDYTDVYYWLYDNVGNSITSGTLTITAITTPTNPRVVLLNSSVGDSPFAGTVYDFLFLDSPEAFQDIYLAGGAFKASWALFWPMREGEGSTCVCVNSGAVLAGFSTFSWTSADDDSNRWI